MIKIKSMNKNSEYDSLITNVLINRGYKEEIIEALLNTGYSDEMPRYNDLTNVEIGADIIESHIDNDSVIYIFGDYDADGVTSSYILSDAINHAIYNTVSNASINVKLPERTEGYGLNMNWCKKIVEQHQGEDVLVITVDNGIAQNKEVAYLLENGIDVLITDHHMPSGKTPKDVYIIDAFYNNDDENNKGLCGAGVAFKLAMTLLDRYNLDYIDDLYYNYMIHVAIATITDSMPMTVENIKYVYNGVQLLKDGYGSEALQYYRYFNSNTDITPKDIAFGLGPQINSCGRMNNTSLALNYLFADEEDVEELYNSVVNTNDERKSKTKAALEMAEELIDVNDAGIIVQLPEVEGIAGIIASNISNKYNKCTVIFCQAGDALIGSGRGDGYINLLKIFKHIESTTDCIVKMGGHASACGITIKKNKFEQFKQLFNDELNKLLGNRPSEEIKDIDIIVDDCITVSDINKENCEALRSLYFFTESNPVFALNNVTITNVKPSGNNPNNVQFSIKDSSGSFTFWSWGIGDHYKEIGMPRSVTLIGELDTKFGKPSFNILNIIPKGGINNEVQ